MRPEPTPAWKTATQVGIALGFLLVIGGVVVRDLQVQAIAENRMISLALLIGGVVITVGCLAANYDLVLRLLVQRRTAEGANAAVMILLAVALTALVCYISTRRYARIDMTGKRIYTLHTKTERMLRTLDRPVEVTIVYFPPAPGALQTDTQAQLVHWGYGQAVAMLDEFAALSKHVTVRKLGLEDPGQLQELRARLDVPGPCIIFEAGERNDVIPLVDIVEMPAWRGVSPSFTGEDAFATALVKIVEGRAQTVYFLTGHGELSIEDQGPGVTGVGEYGLSRLAKRLRADNFEPESLDLTETESVPPDCSVLIIPGPRTALPQRHVAAIRRYLDDRGGRAIVMADPVLTGGEGDPNLNDLLKPYGVRVHSNTLVVRITTRLLTSEGAQDRADAVAPVVRSGYADHPVTADLQRYAVRLYRCAPLEIMPAGIERPVTARPLLTAASDCWGERNPPQRIAMSRYDPDKDMPGPLLVAVVVEPIAPAIPPTETPPERPTGPRIVVLGSSLSFANEVVSKERPNLYLVMNAVNWLAGKGHMVGIPARDIDVNVASVSPFQVRLSRWIFIFALPGAIAALGLVVWQVRRR